MCTNFLSKQKANSLFTLCKLTSAFLFAVAMTASFTSCRDDAEQELDKKTKQDKSSQVRIDSYDDLYVFQNTIVQTDEQGNVISHNYGVPLFDNDPLHLYIGVDNMKEAEDMFNLWMAFDMKVQTGKNGGWVANMTDEQGNAQGTIYLTPGTEENHIAEVTVSDNVQLKAFRQITFLKNSAWPKERKLLKGTRKYYKFDVVKNINMKDISSQLDKSKDLALDFVCIQGSTNGVKPIFCTITNGMYLNPLGAKNCKIIRNSKYCPDSSRAQTIHKLLQADWDGFVEVFKDATCGPLIDDTAYWFNEQHGQFFREYNGAITYKSGYTYGEYVLSCQKYFLLCISGLYDYQIGDGSSI